MRFRSNALAIATISCPLVLTSCGSPYSLQNITVSISSRIASIPVNGTQVFTTTTTNAPNVPLFSINNTFILSAPGANYPAGTFTLIPGDPEGSITYNAPATPPIYTSAQLVNGLGLVQGSVIVSASVLNQPGNLNSTLTSTSITFVITGPISVGLSPATASIKIGSTQQFTGYAVGSVNNALTWQVNGVAGGSTANGSITTTGLYTAPAAMPMTGNTVTVTAVSQADTTKSQSSTITLTTQ